MVISDPICPSATNHSAVTPVSNHTHDATFQKFWDEQKTVPLFLIIILFPLISLKSATFFTKFNALGRSHDMYFFCELDLNVKRLFAVRIIFTYLCFICKHFHIMKMYPCNEYPLISHFYIAKLGFTRAYLFYLMFIKNIYCGYSLEPPRQGSSVYPQSMF